MRRGLAEEIAVLDGLDGFGDIPGYYNAGQQIDASAGANYSGGSNWPGNLPLTPSNAGLASAEDDLTNYYERLNVIDASSGANYSGGSNWPGNLPLTPSNAGLAGYTFGKSTTMSTRELQELLAGAGATNIPMDGIWGAKSVKAVLAYALKQGDDTSVREINLVIRPYAGGRMVLVDNTLVWKMMARVGPSNLGALAGGDGYNMERYVGSTIGSLEGTHIPGYYDAGQVIDASAGANYSGGSSWPGNLPLTPSNAGLAELSMVEPLDGISDNTFKKKLFANQIPAFQRLASKGKLTAIMRAGLVARQNGDMQRASLCGKLINRIRMLRCKILGVQKKRPMASLQAR